MSTWAGPIHGLVELMALSDLEEVAADAPQFTTGLSGRRRVRMTPEVTRRWSCGIASAYPSELATLQEFYWSHRGQAVWLVTEPAQVQNLLPPPLTVRDQGRDVMVPKGWKTGNAETLLEAAGSAPTVDGVAAASVLVTGGGQARLPIVPVRPGVPFTVSAYVTPGATIAVAWMLDGVTQSVSASSAPAGALVEGALPRVSLTLTPEAGQTAAQLRVNAGATTIARPQVTWTPFPVPYVPGKGAEQVIFGPVSETTKKALLDGTFNLSGFTYSVEEVG